MAEEVTFGDRDTARTIRQNPKFQAFLADEDDARESTVKLKENVPERALQDITGEAADSMRHKASQHGQAELTEAEKKKIDFSRTNVMHARSAKAIARGKGVDDWTSYYDETLEVDEHRSVFESAKKDELGRSGIGRDSNSEAEVADRQARAHHQVKEHELGHAKDAAFQGDRDAQGFVQERVDEPDGSFDDVFDMSFSQTDDGRLRGSGRDFERLEERHEDRPQRAQTLDEKRTAQVTRDPFEWMNSPNRYDYPGIDTVQPRELHEDRSPQAQAVDERDVAPIADSREEWAMSPDRYDWRGVDDVDPESFHASRPKAARTRDEKEIAPIADSKQQWAENPGRYDWPGVDRPETYGPTMDTPIPEEERGREAERTGFGESLDALNSGDDHLISAPRGSSNSPAWRSVDEDVGGLGDLETADPRISEAFANQGGFEPGAVLDEAMGEVDDELLEWADDRDRQGSLAGFGMETNGSVHRESREAVEQATEFGIDDRSNPSRGRSGGMDAGTQEGLGGYTEDDEEQNGGLFSF